MFNEKNLEVLKENARKMIEEETNATRRAEMERYFSNAENDSGFFGRIKELSSARTKSHKAHISAQGEKDCSVCFEINGKRKYFPVEIKTNGGRIEKIVAPFIVYSVSVHNKLSDKEIAPTLWKTADFLEMLIACKATKSTNGKNPETAIQVSNRKMWKALEKRLAENGAFSRDRIYKAV